MPGLKTFLLLVFLAMFAFLLLHRERVYVRDPLATVTFDGQKQSGYQVYINYSNDVLLERGLGGSGYGILVQNWNKVPATPAILKCVQYMACMTDADHASTLPLDLSKPGPYQPHTTMSSREVSFLDGDGRHVDITLR